MIVNVLKCVFRAIRFVKSLLFALIKINIEVVMTLLFGGMVISCRSIDSTNYKIYSVRTKNYVGAGGIKAIKEYIDKLEGDNNDC